MRRLALLPLVAALAGCHGADRDVRAAPAPPNRAFTSPADRPAPATVWAVGDGDSTAGGEALARRIARARPDRFLYLGDVYDAGSPEDYARSYTPAYGRLKRITAPTPGNHEWPARRAGYEPYWHQATGRPAPPWYAFTVGGWRVVSLNSEAPHDPGSPQLAWLRREVRHNDVGTCRLAIWHRPLESAGPHGDNPDVRPFHDGLQGHARITLHGHDHDSQRLRPAAGIHAYVAGAGGHSLYPLDAGDRRLRFGDAAHDAALRLRLRPGRARVAFVAADGTVLDRSTVRCRTA